MDDLFTKIGLGGILLVLLVKEWVIPLLLRKRNSTKNLACAVNPEYLERIRVDCASASRDTAELVRELKPVDGIQHWKNPGLALAIEKLHKSVDRFHEKLSESIDCLHDEVKDMRRENQAGRTGQIDRRATRS